MAACLNSGLLASSLKKLCPSLKWTLNTVSWYCIRKKYWQEPTDIFKIHELLSVKTKLTNEASKSKGPQETYINLKWNEDTNWLSLKALGSVFLAATLAPSRPKQNLRHIVKIQLLPGIHIKEDKLYVLKKATTMLRTGTTESTCTPHKLTIFLRRWVQEELTHVWQYNHISTIRSRTADPSKLRPKFSVYPSKLHIPHIYHICFLII